MVTCLFVVPYHFHFSLSAGRRERARKSVSDPGWRGGSFFVVCCAVINGREAGVFSTVDCRWSRLHVLRMARFRRGCVPLVPISQLPTAYSTLHSSGLAGTLGMTHGEPDDARIQLMQTACAFAFARFCFDGGGSGSSGGHDEWSDGGHPGSSCWSNSELGPSRWTGVHNSCRKRDEHYRSRSTRRAPSSHPLRTERKQSK